MIDKMLKSQFEQIVFSEVFIVMGDETYLKALRNCKSEISYQVKQVKKYNKPVIIWMINKMSQENRIELERFFVGYNVIKILELNPDDDASWEAVRKETERLSKEIVRSRVLSKVSFIRIALDSVHYYYSFKGDDVEICLEPCAGGFCVAAYNEKSILLEPRKCTSCNGYLDSIQAMFGERKDDTWTTALVTANDLYKRYIVDKIDSEGEMVRYII